MRRTSDSNSDPIRVDFLPEQAIGMPGRIGLTFAPGKRGPGVTALWQRDLDADIQRLREHWGAHVLVSLLEEHELPRIGIPALYERAAAHRLVVIRFPIRDVSVPASMTGLMALVQKILALAGAGQVVVIHCRGGWGRTGLVGACCLVAAGHDPEAAIALVRQVRPGTVETREQEQYVARFAKAWRLRADVDDEGDCAAGGREQFGPKSGRA